MTQINLAIAQELQQSLQERGLDSPLFFLPRIEEISYRSAIAFRLTAQGGDAIILAQQLFYQLNSSIAPRFSLAWPTEGWLDFSPSPLTLNQWLNEFPVNLSQFSQRNPKGIKIPPSFDLCPYQHTYHRCQNLQRLGREEGILEINSPITWLSSSNRLIFSDKREWALLRQLIHLSDRLSLASSSEILKLTTRLCEEFWLLERYCRIFGEISQKKPQISQARLGLMGHTALMLKLILPLPP